MTFTAYARRSKAIVARALDFLTPAPGEDILPFILLQSICSLGLQSYTYLIFPGRISYVFARNLNGWNSFPLKAW